MRPFSYGSRLAQSRRWRVLSTTGLKSAVGHGAGKPGLKGLSGAAEWVWGPSGLEGVLRADRLITILHC